MRPLRPTPIVAVAVAPLPLLLLLLLLALSSTVAVEEEAAATAASYRILGLFPYPGRSHYIVFDALMTELARRGHRVTVYNPFPKAHPPAANYREVDLSRCFGLPDILAVEQMARFGASKWRFTGETLFQFMPSVRELAGCGPLLRLWNASSSSSTEDGDAADRYDLLVTETFNADLWLLFGHRLRVPVIAFHSSVAHPWMRDAAGAPDHAAYMPHPYSETVAPLSFAQRLQNLALSGYARLAYRFKSERFWDAQVPRVFGTSSPSIGQLASRLDMLFLYEHAAVNGAAPTVPAVAHVAGLNVKPASSLPQVYRSHSLIYNPIMVELAKRGHNVTVYSVYQAASRLPNLRQLDLQPCFRRRPLYDSIESMRCPTALQLLDLIYVELPAYWNVSACQPLAALLRDSPRFDVLITQPFNSDLFSAYARRLRIPASVYLFTSSLHTWLLERAGSPSNPSYIPERGSSFVRPMSFWQRARNAYRYALSELYYRLYFAAESERIYRAALGGGDGDDGGPSLQRIAAETGLVLANTHFSLYPAAPLAPAIVEVAGVNLKNATALPPNIREFIDGSKEGVVYFCMGSLLRGESFPTEKRDAFLYAFSKLPQRVLWKWEGDELPGRTDNIMISKWMPQRDILAHPNVKLFISHGGLLGTSEAVYEGVPILGIPIFGDQRTNVKAIEANGAGELLDYNDISNETVLDKIRTILTNPEYQRKADQLSARYRDRPMSPLDTAVYWTEYVIRHKGAPHLRTAAADMPWYQYLLLDVLAFVAALFAAGLLLLYYVCKLAFALLAPLRRQSIATAATASKQKQG